MEPKNQQPTFFASYFNNPILSLDIINYLLQKNPDVNNKEDDFGLGIPVNLALRKEVISLDILKTLVENKAKLNKKDEGSFPFDLAYINAPLPVVEYLLQNNAKRRTNKSKYLFHTICDNKNVSIEYLQLLKIPQKFMKRIVNDENIKDHTPLHLIARNPNINMDILKYLFENKATVEKNNNGNTPIHYACKNKNINLEIMKLLVSNDAGKTLNEKNSKKLTTVEVYLTNKVVNPYILRLLLDSKAIPFIPKVVNKKEQPLKIASSYSENLSDHVYLVLFTQPEYRFLGEMSGFNENIRKLYEDYINGALWNPSRNDLFPESFKKRVFLFLLICKHISSKNKFVIPRPIIEKMIQNSFRYFKERKEGTDFLQKGKVLRFQRCSFWRLYGRRG